MPAADQGPPFWSESLPALTSRLGSAAAGLTEAEATARLLRDGPNLLHQAQKTSFLRLFVSRFKNPLVLLLIAAGAISAATGDATSSVIVIVMALLSVTLDSVQEYRAGGAADRLRLSVAIRVTVRRGGQTREIAARDLVAGDVVLLSAGSLVPADGRLLEARDCFVNQALLTGEPYPVEKRVVPDPAAGPMTESAAAAFMGTNVLSGSAVMLVCRTGARTALGEIGKSLEVEPPPTAFETGTKEFGFLIIRLAIVMVAFVILVNTARHRPLLESFLFAVALAVGLTPELLPMVISVTLSQGALRMAARKVIVKRLAAIHDLGSMDILCTDKTGTLTEARIRLEQHLDHLGKDSARVLELAYLNSWFETGLKGPLDEAILRHEEVDIKGWTKLDEVPFDFERRRVSVLVADPAGRHILVVKGALEDVLRLSSHTDDPGSPRAIDAPGRQALLERFEALSRQGFRVLGVAWKEVPATSPHVVVNDETGLIFSGFAAFEDPPKTSAAAALAALARSGVTVKVVTGDNELVTRHICESLGIPVTNVLTGPELDTLTDPALDARAGDITLFCRVNPAQKNRVILALKRRGHVVGYLGDGINDASSLHSADVGISVASGVDVAKAAADMILLEQDLAVLHEGVLQGRRTFGNIMKYVMMGTSSNFGNMFSMAGASLFLPFLPMKPVQVLLNNFLYDLSEVPIPMDTVDEDFMERPRRWDLKFIQRFMLVVGPVSSVFDFLTFFIMLRVFHAGEALFQTGWFVESLATQVLVIFVIRTRGNPFKSRPSRILTLTSLTVVAVAAALPFTGLGHRIGFVAPPPLFFLLLALMVIAYLSAVQAVKWWFYRTWTR